VNGDPDEDGRTILATRTTVEPTSMDNPSAVQNVTQGIGSLKLDEAAPSGTHASHNADPHTGSQNHISNGDQHAVPGTPLIDVNIVEWSYIDPQGNIQGPFAGSLMQTWHEAGYFTPDLRMKRIKHDAGWTTVGDMLASAPPDTPVFLLPPPPPQPVIPPGLQNLGGGLGHAGGAGAYTGGVGVPQEASRFRQTTLEPQPSAPASALPYQPIARGGRNVALETFSGMGGPGVNIGSGMGMGIAGAGMHTPSESPASSFTGGRFGNGSPDPMAFGGRARVFGGPQDPMMGSSPARYPHMGGFVDAGAFPGGAIGMRRSTFDGQHGMGMGGGGGWGAPGDHSHTASPVIGSGFGGINGSSKDSMLECYSSMLTYV
jgi:PERQ amino acid-rich with GYF domain-containing protein